MARTKRAGLKDFYGMADERAVSFFRVHESIDVLHNQLELQLLEDSCREPEAQAKAIDSARNAARALWGFLDGVSEAYLPA